MLNRAIDRYFFGWFAGFPALSIAIIFAILVYHGSLFRISEKNKASASEILEEWRQIR